MTATAPDRRVAARFQPAFGTVYRLAPATGNAAVGLVWNISETGLSMMVAQPPDRGAVLAGELAAEGGGPGLPLPARVVHVREAPTGDYIIGAHFGRRLGADELQPFVAIPPRDDTV